MIAKLCLAAAVLFAAALPAQAGGYYYSNNYNNQCTRQSHHSLHSAVGWNASCTRSGCHKSSASSIDDSSLAELAILRIGEKRDESVLLERRLQQRQANLLGLIDKLGLEGNFRLEAYGAAGQLGMYPQQQGAYLPYAQQGSSVYQNQNYGYQGQAQQPIVQPYEPIQLNSLVNALSRSPGDALKFADLAHQRTLQLTSDLTGEAQEANRILAMRDLLQVARAPSQVQRQTYQLSIQENGQPVVQAMPQQPAAVSTPLNPQMVLSTRCVACHSGPNANKIDLTSWDALNETQVGSVMERIRTTDPELRMPRNPDSSPGTPLSLPELQAMFCDPKVGALMYRLRAAQVHQAPAGPQLPPYQK